MDDVLGQVRVLRVPHQADADDLWAVEQNPGDPELLAAPALRTGPESGLGQDQYLGQYQYQDQYLLTGQVRRSPMLALRSSSPNMLGVGFSLDSSIFTAWLLRKRRKQGDLISQSASSSDSSSGLYARKQ